MQNRNRLTDIGKKHQKMERNREGQVRGMGLRVQTTMYYIEQICHKGIWYSRGNYSLCLKL